MTNNSQMLEVAGLNVWFGRTRFHAVKNAAFSIARGKSFGLVGESGSGKTSVLRALSGLAEDWSGDIRIGGEPVEHRRTRKTLRRMQMVFQDPYGSLHPRHTVDRTLGEIVRLHRLEDPDARVRRALDEVGLGATFRFRYPHQLSGGQRQRVSIARALIAEPEILLLDEPTSALDVSVQAEVLNLLSELRRERGLTCILVSHDLAVVAHMCENLAVMRNGKILESVGVNALRAGSGTHPYTAELVRASRGYDRRVAAEFSEEEN